MLASDTRLRGAWWSSRPRDSPCGREAGNVSWRKREHADPLKQAWIPNIGQVDTATHRIERQPTNGLPGNLPLWRKPHDSDRRRDEELGDAARDCQRAD